MVATSRPAASRRGAFSQRPTRLTGQQFDSGANGKGVHNHKEKIQCSRLSEESFSECTLVRKPHRRKRNNRCRIDDSYSVFLQLLRNGDSIPGGPSKSDRATSVLNNEGVCYEEKIFDVEDSEARICEGGNYDQSYREEKCGEGIPNSQASSDGLSTSIEILEGSGKPTLPPQAPLSEVDSLLRRLSKLKRPKHDVPLNFVYDDPSTYPTHSDVMAMLFVNTIDQAKETLSKLEGMSLVEYKKYQKNVDVSIQALSEWGCLSEEKKSALLLFQQCLNTIYEENLQACDKLSEFECFQAKVTATEKYISNMIEKAKYLEMEYINLCSQMVPHLHRIEELETALHHAKAELGKIKNHQQHLLADLGEHLESANCFRKRLKDDEETMKQSKIEAEALLNMLTREWAEVIKINNVMNNQLVQH